MLPNAPAPMVPNASSSGGGGGTPGGTSGQLQWNSSSTFAGVSGSTVDANGSIALGGATVTTSDPVLNITQTWNAGGVTFTGAKINVTDTASAAGSFLADWQVGGNSQYTFGKTGAFYNYNVRDSTLTNYERAIFDWTTTTNVLTIGTQNGGTGTARSININSAGGVLNFASGAAAPRLTLANIGGNIVSILTSQGTFGFSAVGDTSALNYDTMFFRGASGVWAFSKDGFTINGWFNYGGQTRVTSDVTFTSTAVLATVTGLSVNVQAGRTYKFTAELSWTDAAAGGIQAAIAGTCTATNIIYDGWIIDSAANGIKGNAQATALGSAVASATTTGTAGHLTIEGTITVNAAGTLLVQAAQNTSNGTATTIKRGSTFIVQDMP